MLSSPSSSTLLFALPRPAVLGLDRVAVEGRDLEAVEGRDLEAVEGRDLEKLVGRAERTAFIPLPLPFGPAVAGRLDLF